MTSDALAKSMVHASLLLLLTAGIIRFFNVDKHKVTPRVMPTVANYDEHDLTKTDQEMIDEITKKKNVTKISYASVLCGIFKEHNMQTARMIALATSLPMTSARGHEEDKDYAGPGMFTFLILPTAAVLIAQIVQKLFTYAMDYVRSRWKSSTARKVKVEIDQDEA